MALNWIIAIVGFILGILGIVYNIVEMRTDGLILLVAALIMNELNNTIEIK